MQTVAPSGESQLAWTAGKACTASYSMYNTLCMPKLLQQMDQASFGIAVHQYVVSVSTSSQDTKCCTCHDMSC
jgi:hypothetical protein